MRNLSRNLSTEPNAASMADIAFLLLIFFMVTTTIVNDQGLDLLLPPFRENQITSEMHERNIFTIRINSQDHLLVENNQYKNYNTLNKDIKQFILNRGKDPSQSDSPAAAVISIKTNRGTSQEMFIHVLDEAKAAYYEIYAEALNMTPEDVRALNPNDPAIRVQYQTLKKEIPMNISIAEPDSK